MPTYKVVAPLVQLKVVDPISGPHFRQYYAGALVPAEVDAVSLRDHLDSGQVAELGTAEAALGTPAGTPIPALPGTPIPALPPNVTPSESFANRQPIPPFSDELLDAVSDLPVDEVPEDAPEVDEPPAAVVASEPVSTGPARPRGNSSEASWREYHVEQLRAQGVDEQTAREQAAGMSRDDLRAHYAE